MVGRVEGERSLSNEPTSETVFMRVVQNAESNFFNPKAFLEDAGILCQRKDATATYNPTSGTLEMTDVLTYLRAVAEQHIPEIYDAANNPETGIYAEGKQLTPEEKRAAVQTLLLLTESSEDLQASLKESEIRQVEMGINDLFEINGPLWDQENADSLLSTEARRSIGQAVASLPEEQINAQMAAYIKENPTIVLKDILARSMNQDATENIGITITPEQLKAYLIANPLDVFKFNNGLVSQTDKDIRKTVVWGTKNVDRKTIQSLVKENPLFTLQTGEGMLEIIPRDTSKIIIEAMKALTLEQVKAPLTANPLDILKVVPANLSYLKPETKEALKEEASKLRFKLRGAEQTEETPAGPAVQAQPAAETTQKPVVSTTDKGSPTKDQIEKAPTGFVDPESLVPGETLVVDLTSINGGKEPVTFIGERDPGEYGLQYSDGYKTYYTASDVRNYLHREVSTEQSAAQTAETGKEAAKVGPLSITPDTRSWEATVKKIETQATPTTTPTTEGWQNQLRQRVAKENLTEGKEISQSFVDFVQSLFNQGISHDKIAAEIGHYTQEKKSTIVALAETNQAVSTTSTRQEITLGREAIGTSLEGLINGVNQTLTRSASSEISLRANPEAVIDYLKTIELPLGSKIKAANTQIRGNQLSISGIVGTKAGRLEFDVTYMQAPDGKLVVVGEPTIKTDWKLNLALKAKGLNIEETIAHLDQIMAAKINQKVDPRWTYAGFRIAGNQLALDFKKK